MRAVGVIATVYRRILPTIMAGMPARVAGRVGLKIESLTDEDGGAIDPANYLGLEFEGAPDLPDRFAAGQRVAIETTTPSGMHIAKIARLD